MGLREATKVCSLLWGCPQTTAIQELEGTDDLLELGVDSTMANVICTVSLTFAVVGSDTTRLCTTVHQPTSRFVCLHIKDAQIRAVNDS